MIEPPRMAQYQAIPRVIDRATPPEIEPLYVKRQPPDYDIPAGTVKSSNRQMADVIKTNNQADKGQLYSGE